MEKYLETIDSLLSLQERIRLLIYGAGGGGGNFLQTLHKVRPDIHVAGFVDSSKEGEKDGLPVVRLDKFAGQSLKADAIVVAVAEIYRESIRESLRNNGFKTIYFASDHLIAADPFSIMEWNTASFKARCMAYMCQQSFEIKGLSLIGPIDLCMTGLGVAKDGRGFFFDIMHFAERNLERWWVPEPPIQSAVKTFKEIIPSDMLPDPCSFPGCLYGYNFMGHTCHYSPDKMIISANVFYLYIINTKTKKASVIPDDYDKKLYIYCDTGCFSSDYEYWYFVRWPMSEAHEVRHGKRDTVSCELGRLRILDQSLEILYTLDYSDNIHQINIFDDRFLVFTTFKWEMNIPYPESSISEDPEGFRKSHLGGMKLNDMATVDIEDKRHWFTEIPTPVPAHFEVDPKDNHVFYVSSHNFSFHQNDLILEGPGVIYKINVSENHTTIRDRYSDKNFFRLTQHKPFVYKNRVLIAVTNLPNHLDILDAESMSLWRRVTLFDCPAMDFETTGNALCHKDPRMCLSLEVCRHGEYIVLESSNNILIYSLKKNRVITTIDRHLPEHGTKGGHTRVMGG